jgi:hypothetical protein
MLAVVADASPLIYLARLGRFLLLRELHDAVFVPPAVWAEVAIRGEGWPESRELKAGVSEGWIQIRRATSDAPLGSAAEHLGRADTEAILLARELRAVLLTDDAEAREVAEALSVKVAGTIAVLIRARLEGKIDRLQPVLDQLRTETNFRMSEAVYTQALRAVAELA